MHCWLELRQKNNETMLALIGNFRYQITHERRPSSVWFETTERKPKEREFQFI